MRKRLMYWQAAGFIFTSVMGVLLHFAYEWSGKNAFIAAFSAVNESTWEHMKLLFMPMFAFSLVEAWVLGKHYRNFWLVKALGILLGVFLIPVLYYTYTGALGISQDWVNIAIFFIAAGVAYLLETRLLVRSELGGGLELISLIWLWLLALVFMWLTFHPIHIPLFQDPLTGLYGLA